MLISNLRIATTLREIADTLEEQEVFLLLNILLILIQKILK